MMESVLSTSKDDSLRGFEERVYSKHKHRFGDWQKEDTFHTSNVIIVEVISTSISG